MSALEHRRHTTHVQRQLQADLSELDAQQELAERKMAAHRQVGQYGMAQSLPLREWLRVIEQHNPDAAPTAAVFVRLAEGGIIAAAMEFEAGL